ncbi:MAG TPA: hypothetical protein VHE13_04845 [Opitutus sp.]|nr:hypothetical protein [Opitutus sp.]
MRGTKSFPRGAGRDILHAHPADEPRTKPPLLSTMITATAILFLLVLVVGFDSTAAGDR